MNKLTNEALLQRYMQGEREAFNILAVRCQKVLMHSLRQRVQHDTAQVVSQKTLISLFQAPERFKPERGRLEKFLLYLANGFLGTEKRGAFRRGRLREKFTDDKSSLVPTTEGKLIKVVVAEDTTKLPLENKEWMQRFWAAVEQIPETWRKPFLMAYVDGQTHLQISKTLRLTERSISNRVQRAVRKLRTILNNRDVDEQLATPSHYAKVDRRACPRWFARVDTPHGTTTIRKQMEKLPDPDYSVCDLIFFRGHTIPEVSDRLGMPEHTIQEIIGRLKGFFNTTAVRAASYAAACLVAA